MADAPQNSLTAFRNALAKGANGLESDVWVSTDGEPLLHHGPLHRERVEPLSLAGLFAACGTDFDLSLDMKGPGAASRTVEVCRESGFDLSRLWLCGGSLSSAAWRGLDPSVRLVTDLSWRSALLSSAAGFARLADAGIDAANLRHGRWTRGLVQRAHDVGLLAFGWDVQTRLTMRHALWIGLDGVYSDHPDLLPR